MTNLFISHSTKDVEFVLTHLKAPCTAIGIDAWCSATDMRLAADWEQQIRRELARSDWFIVVLSPDAAKSEWVQAETHWALENKHGRIIPVMARGCDPCDVHIRLGRLQYIDFRSDPARGWLRVQRIIEGKSACTGHTMIQPAAQDASVQTRLIRKPRSARLALTIDIIDGRSEQRTFEVHSWAILGRSPEADIQINDDCVSRKHARLSVAPAARQLTLCDLDSANGTFLNGVPVSSDQPIKPGDLIEVGNTRIRVRGFDAI
jgi:hypothetical protein